MAKFEILDYAYHYFDGEELPTKMQVIMHSGAHEPTFYVVMDERHVMHYFYPSQLYTLDGILRKGRPNECEGTEIRIEQISYAGDGARGGDGGHSPAKGGNGGNGANGTNNGNGGNGGAGGLGGGHGGNGGHG